jgi:hypothetical protein
MFSCNSSFKINITIDKNFWFIFTTEKICVKNNLIKISFLSGLQLKAFKLFIFVRNEAISVFSCLEANMAEICQTFLALDSDSYLCIHIFKI